MVLGTITNNDIDESVEISNSLMDWVEANYDYVIHLGGRPKSVYKSPYQYIYVNYEIQPPVFICRICGRHRQLHVPSKTRDILLQADAFAEAHKDCWQKNNV